MNTNYITCKNEYAQNFFAMPKEIFTNPKYKNLSNEAKILYTLLLDRTSLSLQNHFIDNMGRVYIFFTRENASIELNCSTRTAPKIFKELLSAELIEEKIQGNKKANIIYVKYPEKAIINKDSKNIATKKRKTMLDKKKEFLKKINTNIKVKHDVLNKLDKTISKKHYDINKLHKQLYTNSIITINNDDINEIKSQIEYDYFINNKYILGINTSIIDTLVIAIAEMKIAPTTKINNVFYPSYILDNIISKINSVDIINILSRIKQIGFYSINNLKSYIKTTLFNFTLQEDY